MVIYCHLVIRVALFFNKDETCPSIINSSASTTVLKCYVRHRIPLSCKKSYCHEFLAPQLNQHSTYGSRPSRIGIPLGAFWGLNGQKTQVVHWGVDQLLITACHHLLGVAASCLRHLVKSKCVIWCCTRTELMIRGRRRRSSSGASSGPPLLSAPTLLSRGSELNLGCSGVVSLVYLWCCAFSTYPVSLPVSDAISQPAFPYEIDWSWMF